jgi:hypothetical protein
VSHFQSNQSSPGEFTWFDDVRERVARELPVKVRESETLVMSDLSEPQDVLSQLFNKFCDSNDLQEVLTTFQSLCTEAQISNTQSGFYNQLKSKLSNWRSKSLWEILDKKVDCPVYDRQSVCEGANVLVVGAGPCGLRFAVEAALLGAGKASVDWSVSY